MNTNNLIKSDVVFFDLKKILVMEMNVLMFWQKDKTLNSVNNLAVSQPPFFQHQNKGGLWNSTNKKLNKYLPLTNPSKSCDESFSLLESRFIAKN